MYINPSTELLNIGSTLKATTRAFCLIYFLIKTGKRKLPGSSSSMILSNLFKSDSRGEAVVPITGSRNGRQGQVFDGGHKIKSVKVVSEYSFFKRSKIFVMVETSSGARLILGFPEIFKKSNSLSNSRLPYFRIKISG